MKFRWKIFWLCIIVYISTLLATCIIVTERSYGNLIKTEVNRCIKEEENVHHNINLYLLANMKLVQGRMYAQDYCTSIVDMFGTKETYLQFYSLSLQQISSNVPLHWKINQLELKTAVKNGRNYVLRHIDGRYYIFITDIIGSDNDEVIMSFVKDISYVDEQRGKQYKLFLESGIVGLSVVAVIVQLMGRIVMSPIEKLNCAAKSISSGNFNQRVNVTTKDEIGMLAEQFNIMAEEIENDIEQLRTEGERKQVFINNLTHELRTPLTSIIGYSELMLKIKYDENIFQKGLCYINSEGNRMFKMINRLMDIILLRNGGFNFEVEEVIPLMKEVKDIMKVKLENKNINLEISGENLHIKMDKDLIKEVLLNIVDNALNVSGERDTILVQCGRTDGHTYITVKDEGKGISKEDIARILEPFYRVDSSRSTKNGGMGLGLAICNEIIKGHGAELRIESEIGKGTSVSIIF